MLEVIGYAQHAHHACRRHTSQSDGDITANLGLLRLSGYVCHQTQPRLFHLRNLQIAPWWNNVKHAPTLLLLLLDSSPYKLVKVAFKSKRHRLLGLGSDGWQRIQNRIFVPFRALKAFAAEFLEVPNQRSVRLKRDVQSHVESSREPF